LTSIQGDGKNHREKKNVFANKSTLNLYEAKASNNVLSKLYHEVMFRKQNDYNFDELTNLSKVKDVNYSSARVPGRERISRLKSRSKIGDYAGNQNQGAMFNESNHSAFMLRRKTNDIEDITLRRTADTAMKFGAVN